MAKSVESGFRRSSLRSTIGGMNESNTMPRIRQNRVKCDVCGQMRKSTFTVAAADGVMDLRSLCEDCHRQFSFAEFRRARKYGPPGSRLP